MEDVEELIAVIVVLINLVKDAVVVDTTLFVKLIAWVKMEIEILVANNVKTLEAIKFIEAIPFTTVAVKVLNNVNNLDIVAFEDTAELKVCKKDFVTIPEKDADENGSFPNIMRLLRLRTG
jgi:hypothetical protein